MTAFAHPSPRSRRRSAGPAPRIASRRSARVRTGSICSLLLISAALSLLSAAPAEAKGVEWVEVCGPFDCARTSGEDLASERRPLIFPPWVMSGRPGPPPEQAARWLRVRVRIGSERMTSVVLPRPGYAGGDQGGGYGFVWQRLDRDERRTYRSLGHGVRRFSSSSLPGLPAARRGPPEMVDGAGTAHSIALGAQLPAFVA